MRHGARTDAALPWVLLCVLLLAGAVGLSLLGAGHAAEWDWQPGAGQPWRLWTAAFVHWSPLHLAMNAAATVLLAWLGWRAQATMQDATAWALAWPLTHLGLLLQPGLQHYGGLSGVLHAGVAILALRLLRRAGPLRQRAVGALLLAGLLTKLALEAPWRMALQTQPGGDFAVAPLAHATGALAGLACAVLLMAWAAARPLRRLASP